VAITAARAAADVAGVACVGLALVGVLLPAAEPRTRREHAAVRRAGNRALVVLGGAWAGLVLVGATVRAADAFGRPVAALAVDDLRRWSVELAAGRGLLLAAVCALAVAGCAAVALHDPDHLAPSVPLVVALLGLVTPAVTGTPARRPTTSSPC
jgi:putative copper resistance protein D